MVLFLCETKSQLFNAVVLRLSLFKNEVADLCICYKIAMPTDYEERIKKIGAFNHVYSFNMPYIPEHDFVSMVKKSIHNVNLVNNVGELLSDMPTNYDKVFVSGPGTACPAVYYWVRKHNRKVILSLYEEGTFEYVIFNFKYNRQRRIYSKLFYGRFYLDDAKELYVYNTDLVVNSPDRIKIIEMPKVNIIEEIINTENIIFNNTVNKTIDINQYSYLFLESCYTDPLLINLQYEIVKKMYLILGERLAVKMHPRSNKGKYDGIGVAQIDVGQSMELMLLNKSIDLDNKTIISVASSALFNIYLMFGLEPRFILLNKLFGKSSKEIGLDDFIKYFIAKYPKGKIIQPISLDELNSQL